MKGILILFFFTSATLGYSQKVDMSVFEQMKTRQVGPAGMSGRITCIDVVHDEPNTIYIGAASGGVWKSTSGGTEWEPIGDTMETINIGALAIQQSNPSVIWVGTGEGNPRNSQSSGFGLYKSLDAGRTWQLVGLKQTRNIHKILIHPEDPNTIWVGAQGPAWGDNSNRGVYKTTDGGVNWKLVLEGNENTGIGDLVLDPRNPNKLIANLWEFRRNPWFFKSGGESSGIFVTFDGGDTWKKRTEDDGLPKGDIGRVGLAISPSNPNRVYALVEAKENALYRSDDGGFKWKKVSTDKNAGNRPFYYSDIFVDPQNENRIYSLWSRVSLSEDGGKTWKVIIPYSGVHPDHHAFWVHPTDPSYVIIGNDGGMAISRDRAQSWRFVANLPLAQYYHINIDNELPYNIYGGMQDNGSWRGPAYVWAAGGIRNSYFEEVMFGDGFDVSPDPLEPNRYGYAMSQGGHLGRYDLETGYTKGIQPTTGDSTKLRYSWNAPLAQDPFEPRTIYYGSQFLHRSDDNGDSWRLISPDLTTNDTSKQKQLQSGGLTFDVTGAENYTTLTAITPSPVDSKMIWVGSDDGRVSLTKDDGDSWLSLESKLPSMPKGAWITQIHASNKDANEAFVVVNDYRRNNWKPYLYHTVNGGKSWKRIASEEDFSGYCLSVIQDPVEPNLLFLGTENGLYISLDRGQTWNHWRNGYPNVSTMDMKIQERERDLVIGTFGRAAYVLDDIAPLRSLAKDGLDKWKEERLKVFEIPDAYQAQRKSAPGVRFGGDALWEGQNRTVQARVQIYFHKKDGKDPKKKVKGKMRVYNEKGDTIRTSNVELVEGLNRIYWNLDQKRSRFANETKKKEKDDENGGIPVRPGTYSIEIECDSIKSSAQVVVKGDPRINMTTADYENRERKFEQAFDLMDRMTAVCDELRSGQAAIKKVKQLIPEEKDDQFKEIEKLSKKMNDTIQGMLDDLLGKKDVKGIFRDSDIIISKVQQPLWATWGNLQGNDQAFENKLNQAIKAFEAANTDIQHFLKNEWKDYREKVLRVKLDPFAE